MKKKISKKTFFKTLFVTTALIAVNSSFGATGKGYRILSEEIHSAPGFNFHVEDTQQGASSIQKKSFLSGRTRTQVPSKSARVNESITVEAYHDFNISNNTKKRQVYEEYVSLNCDNLRSYYTRHIEVYPGGYYNNNEHSYGTVQESYAANYRIEGETKLSGESSDSSRDSNILYVSRK